MRAITIAACVATLLALPVARGAAEDPANEPTREGYVAAVDPICKRNAEANRRTLKGVRRQVARGRLKAAGARFARAARALRSTIAELRPVPRPPADQERLSRWLAYLGDEAALLGRTATNLRHGDRAGALGLSKELLRTAARADREVIPFPFHYCRSEPSQFL